MFYTFIRYFRSIKIQLLLVSFVVVFGFTVGFSQAQSHHDWSHNLTMYEVNVRQYSESGTFAAVEADLDRLEDLGVGILWFMPIHPIGEVNRLGSLGSYYSVKDYRGINPDFGTKEDFKSLVDAAHERGMYVLMDWVPNHTSWDNVLTETNPDWYVRESGRFISPPGTNWSDVIQLDHSQPGLRDYMVDAMRYWVDSLGVDGYRFDAASFVPDAFWTEVLPRVRESRSDLFFLAEDDNPKYHRLGFDSSFGWGFYGFGGGVLSQIAAGQAGPSQLGTYLVNESRTYRQGQYRLYFTSNHDENSWEGTTQERFGLRADLFAVLSMTVHGMPLIYNGQEAGLNKRLAFFEKDLIPWQEHPNFEMYQRLIALKKRNAALWQGDTENVHRRIYTDHAQEVFGFIREKGDDKVLVFANLSTQSVQARITTELSLGRFMDVFNDESRDFSQDDLLQLPPAGYVVYEYAGTETALDTDELPRQTALLPAYPNPFNPSTTVQYRLATASSIQLALYDLNGREVMQLEQGWKHAGNYWLSIDASALSTGIYILRLVSAEGVQSRKLSLIR